MDAHSSQSFTSTFAGTQTIDKGTHTVTIDTVTGMYHSKPKDDEDARTQAEIDDEILLEEHYNRKAGIYPEPEGDPSY